MRETSISQRVLFALFFSLSLYMIAFKSVIGQAPITGSSIFIADYADWRDVCIGAGRPCFRMTSAIIGQSIEELYRWLAGAFFWDVSSSAFFMGSPWSINDIPPAKVTNLIIPVCAYLSFALLLLYPILMMCKRMFEGFPERVLFLMVSFSVLIGWHPVAVNLWFNFASIFIDWPRSYYLFHQRIVHYDFGTIGVLLMGLLYLARPAQRSILTIAVLAVLMQATIEHLGIVFAFGVLFAGIANCLSTEGRREWHKPFLEWLAAFSTAIVAAVLLSSAFYLLSGSSVATGSRGDVTSFMSEKWWTTVENNFNWIKTITANVISMTILPAIAGAAIGTISGFRNKKAESAKHEDDFIIAMIASGMIIGYLLAGVTGLFFVAYPAEMGRQFLALALLTVIAAAKFTELGIERIRH